MERTPRKRGATDAYQDRCEGVPLASVGGWLKRACMRAPDYVQPEDRAEYLLGYREQCTDMYGPGWDTPAEKKPMTPSTFHVYCGNPTNPFLVFHQWDVPVGNLTFGHGDLHFEGDKHASARVFFEQILQPQCAALVRQRDPEKVPCTFGPLLTGVEFGVSLVQQIDGENIHVAEFTPTKEGDLTCKGDLSPSAREWYETALRPLCIGYMSKALLDYQETCSWGDGKHPF